MTDQELQLLARKYAEQNPPQGLKDEALKRVLIGKNAEIFGKFLIWLTKTHCIVSQEKVKEGYEGWRVFLGTKDEDKAMAAMWELEELFGTELFEERNEK